MFLIAFFITKAIQDWGEFYRVHGKAIGSSLTRRIQYFELCGPLPKANHECKEEKIREKSNIKKFKRIATLGHISSTFWGPFHVYYMSFWSLGSQESNTSNGMWIGAEMKKLWPFEANHTKLKANFAVVKSQCASCEIILFVQIGDFQLAKSHSPCCMLQNPPKYFQIFATDSFRFVL